MGYPSRSMFADEFVERRDLEQYFWTRATVDNILTALVHEHEEGQVCCLSTPTLAHAFFVDQGREEALLDIDKRFDYLPRFRFFDLRMPTPCATDDFQVVVFDPPFFYIPMETLLAAVMVVVGGNVKTKLLFGFLRREEKNLLQVFKEFNLKRTKFVLEYEHVKPNKWRNYALYSNVDLPGIKRVMKG